MKCKKLYKILCDCEIAQSISGSWFIRSYDHNSFGYTWSKWMPLSPISKITRETVTFQNMNGNEITERRMAVKFGKDLYYIKSTIPCIRNSRCRLPF